MERHGTRDYNGPVRDGSRGSTGSDQERLRNAIPAPDAEDFAFQLGFIPNPGGQNLPKSQRILEYMITRLNNLESASYRARTISRFCARYLFSLIHAFLNPEMERRGSTETDSHYRLHTMFAVMLRYVDQSQSPYLAQLFLSEDATCKELVRRLPDYIVLHFSNESQGLDRVFMDAENSLDAYRAWAIMFPIIEHLLTTLTLLHGENYPLSEASTLVSYLDRWSQKVPNAELELRCQWLAALLRRDGSMDAPTYVMREQLEGLDHCSRPGCQAREDLYICEICKTALYCGRRHQRFHWNAMDRPHKDNCYRMTYTLFPVAAIEEGPRQERHGIPASGLVRDDFRMRLIDRWTSSLSQRDLDEFA